jgi:peptide/nickel transport system permease protein
VLLAVFGPLLVRQSPLTQNALIASQPPSAQHWLGTTYFGEDVFSQFVYGTRASFVVGVLGGGLAALVGMVIGFTAGYRGGIIDEVLNMLTNVVLVIPSLALLIIIGGYLRSMTEIDEALFISPAGPGRRGRSAPRRSRSSRGTSSGWPSCRVRARARSSGKRSPRT